MAFDPWAGTNQGISNIGNTMMSLAQLKRQDEEQAKKNRLVDLQTQAAEQQMNDQTALRTALASAQGGFTYPEPQGVGPFQPGPRIGLSALGPIARPANAEDRMGVMADLASQGNTAAMELYGKAESLNQKLAEHKAQAEAYGDAEGAAKAEIVLKKMDASGKALENWMKVDPSGELARQQIAANPDLFNGMDPSKMQMGDGKKTPPVFFPAGDGGFTFYDGKEWKHVKKEVEKPDPIMMMDKRFEQQQQLQNQQISAQDRRTAQQIAAADRRSAARADGSSKPPSGYRWASDGSLEAIPGGPGDTHGKGGKVLPAGQLESIADMKRVKDVMAEARQALSTKKVETGPVMGRLQSLGSSVGLASDNFVDVQQKLQTAENIMLKLRSGAAVTESEYSRFQKEFPRVSDPPEIMKRKMNNAIAYANTLMDDKLSIYEEGGYRIPQSVRSNGAQAAPSKAQASAKPATKGKSGGYSDLLNKYKR